MGCPAEELPPMDSAFQVSGCFIYRIKIFIYRIFPSIDSECDSTRSFIHAKLRAQVVVITINEPHLKYSSRMYCINMSQNTNK